MSRYLRDWLGHFATPSEAGKRCQHPCCRGKRQHPKGMPVAEPEPYGGAVPHFRSDHSEPQLQWVKVAAGSWAGRYGSRSPFNIRKTASGYSLHHEGKQIGYYRTLTDAKAAVHSPANGVHGPGKSVAPPKPKPVKNPRTKSGRTIHIH